MAWRHKENFITGRSRKQAYKFPLLRYSNHQRTDVGRYQQYTKLRRCDWYLSIERFWRHQHQLQRRLHQKGNSSNKGQHFHAVSDQGQKKHSYGYGDESIGQPVHHQTQNVPIAYQLLNYWLVHRVARRSTDQRRKRAAHWWWSWTRPLGQASAIGRNV